MFSSCIIGYGCFTLACAICDELLYRFAVPHLFMDIEIVDGRYVAKRGETETEADVEANASYPPSPSGTEKGEKGKYCCGLRVLIQLGRRRMKHKFQILRILGVHVSDGWKATL